MSEYAPLVMWMIGMFSIIAAVVALIYRMVIKDSFQYDEAFVWRRKVSDITSPPKTRGNG